MGKSELVDLTLALHHETYPDQEGKGAILVSDDDEEEHAKWLPKSQVEFVKLKGSVVEVTMPLWLAKTKGLV